MPSCHCKFLDSGQWCKYGCNGTTIYCHHFLRGTCRFGDQCRRVHSGQRREESPGWAGGSRVRAACDILNIKDPHQTSAKIVDAIFKVKAMELHPDRHPAASDHERAELNETLAKFTNARDVVQRWLDSVPTSRSASSA